MARGEGRVNTPGSRSRALLVFMTWADQRRRLAFAAGRVRRLALRFMLLNLAMRGEGTPRRHAPGGEPDAATHCQVGTIGYVSRMV
jgi:hypothetical protein